MTTIAINTNVVAADMMMTGAYIDQVEVKKIKKVNCSIQGFRNEEVIVGGAGSFAEVLYFMDWIEGGGSKDTYRYFEGNDFFLVSKTGIFIFDNYHKPIHVGSMAAFGTGAKYAMGAMMAGMGPAEAVNIAMELDPYSGKGVYTLAL